jgi:O-antigen ligase
MLRLKSVKILNYTELVLCLLMVFLIPIVKPTVRYLIVFWLFFAFLNFLINKNKSALKDFLNNPIALLPVLYFLHIIGLFFTSDIANGMFYLEIKMSLFFVPLALFLRRDLYKDKKLLFARIFILACFSSLLLCLLRAYGIFLDTSDYKSFFYENLSNNIHPSYLSIYLIFAFFMLTEFKAKDLFMKLKASVYIKYFLILSFLVFIILLSSKAAIISFIFVLIIYLYIQLRRRNIKHYLIWCLISIVIALQIVLIFKIPFLNTRFTSMYNVSKQFVIQYRTGDVSEINSVLQSSDGNSLRIALWMSAFDLGRESFLTGTGTGDVNTDISRKLHKINLEIDDSKFFNAHNQYLQTFAAIGFFGLLLLLLIIFFGFRNGIRYKDNLFVYFMIVIAVNMLFESLLEQQLGVIFFSLFYSLLSLWQGSYKSTL